MPENAENHEKDQAKLDLRLKRNRSEIVSELILSVCEDSSTHTRLGQFLSGLKNNILETDEMEQQAGLYIFSQIIS